jgi:hypothetical protein
MGEFLQAGHTYADGQQVNAANLNEHVNESIIKPTAISGRTLKDPSALSDEVLINDAGVLKKVTLQQLQELFIQPGTLVSYGISEYRTWLSFGFQIPDDDTIPQNTEGTEIISLAMTPKFASSIIRAHFHAPEVFITPFVTGVAAIFVDATINAIGSQATWGDNTGNRMDFNVIAHYAPGSISPVTFKVRIGPGSGGVLYMNGTSVSRTLGGSQAAVLILEEFRQ